MPTIFQNTTKAADYTEAVDHDGLEVEVIRELGDDERDLEVGRMFEVRGLLSGVDFTAFADELIEVAPANPVRDALVKVLLDAGLETARGYGQPVAAEVADAIIAELGLSMEWGTVHLSKPDAVGVAASEEAARNSAGYWNQMKEVRQGKTERGAVVSRLVGAWTQND